MKLTSNIALLLGSPGVAVAGLNTSAPAKARPLTVAANAGVAEPLEQVSILVDGHLVGEAQFRQTLHPQGLARSCAELLINVFGDAAPSAWLTDALLALTSFAKGTCGLATLQAKPVGGDIDEAATVAGLIAAGFAGPDASGVFVRELMSMFWRRSGIFIIAEAGSNWRMGSPSRDLAMARSLIDVAADAGVDAIKFQTFRAETVYVAEAGASDYLAEAGHKQDIREIFDDIAMPYAMLSELAEHARARGLAFMSTAFSPADFAAVDPLVAVHKIASYEITHIRLIELAARSGKPTLMSTGAASLSDVAWAVEHYQRCGGRDLCLMQCTARYPAPLATLNLASIPELSRRFGVPAGLSDHSREPVIGPVAAAALGACAIEKHLTLHNLLPGPDHAFAVTPSELAVLVAAVRAASAARGTGIKEVLAAEEELAAFAQRGLQAVVDIRPGDVLIEDGNIAILRPGKQPKGVHSRYLAEVAGKRATRPIRSGEGLRLGDWAES